MSMQEKAGHLKIKGTLFRKELIGEKTKKEKEILKSLTNWHKKSCERNFFIGEKISPTGKSEE